MVRPQARPAGALVNLGGDLRCAGTAPADGWTVKLDDPFDRLAAPLARLTISDGAVATSSPLARRWWQGDRERHHLIDPATGQPAVSDIAAVSVVCREGWRAEALAKAAFLAGADEALDVLDAHGATGLVIAIDGRVGVGPRLRGRLQLRNDLRRPRRSRTGTGATGPTTELYITAELAAGGRSARFRVPAGPPEQASPA